MGRGWIENCAMDPCSGVGCVGLGRASVVGKPKPDDWKEAGNEGELCVARMGLIDGFLSVGGGA